MSSRHGKSGERDLLKGYRRCKVLKIAEGEDWILGYGTTANIYLAEDSGCPGRLVALKVIKYSMAMDDSGSEELLDAKLREQAVHEVFHHQGKKHEHIIEYFGAYMDGIHPVLVLEVAAGGDLVDRVIEKGKFSEKDASNIIKQVSSAVKYLHNLEKPIFFADIKLDNMLLVSKKEFPGTVKLADFGLACTLESSEAEISSEGGSPGYESPEQTLLKKGGLKTDIWCIGVATFVLLTGQMPFGRPFPNASFRNVEGYNSISEYGRTFIESLFKNHKDRPNAAETYTLAEEWHRGAPREETLDGSRLDKIRKWYKDRSRDLSAQRGRKIEHRNTLSGTPGGSSHVAHAGRETRGRHDGRKK